MSKEVLSVRVSRKLYIPIYIMVFILISTIIFIKITGREFDGLSIRIALIFSVLGLMFTEAHRFRNVYQVDHQHLTHITGVLFKTTKKTDLLAVSDAELKQNPWQMLLGFGDVNILVFSRESSTAVKNIDNPKKFINFLEESIDQKRGSGPSGH
ncbi:MAG TPA: PH domain-containing protein [Candidatus Nanoarchaeia archaeon]|nr:PH domain-containing protein [Candidatus Nanoarchaeia archaeon]